MLCPVRRPFSLEVLNDLKQYAVEFFHQASYRWFDEGYDCESMMGVYLLCGLIDCLMEALMTVKKLCEVYFLCSR